MRASMLALAAAAALFVGPVPAFSQGIQFEVGPGGVRVNPGRRGESRQCEELRLACENRDRLGERGEGNCRRYRTVGSCGERASSGKSWASGAQATAVGTGSFAEARRTIGPGVAGSDSEARC